MLHIAGRVQRTVVVCAAIALFAVGCGPSGLQDEPDDPVGGTPDASGPTTPQPDAAACLTASAAGEEALSPVDIIWVVDSSGSMDDENTAVQNALNDFSASIAASGVDYRVVLIGDNGSMSVPPPLGGSPEFLHVNQSVDSHNALEMVHARYADYQSFLRPNAVVHFVVVSDDESNWSQSQFDSQLAGLANPGFPNGYTFHSICSEETVIFTPPAPLPPVMGPCLGGLGAGGAAAPGLTYIDMTNNTSGVWKSICSSNWDAVFTAVAQAVSVSTPLPCTYDIPPPPDGQSLDPNAVNFVFQPSSGGDVTVPRVDNAAACGSGSGWYYDDPQDPAQIVLCPSSCDELTADPEGEVEIQYGCATIVD